MRRRKPALPGRSRHAPSVRRCVASGRAAARTQKAAMSPPHRRRAALPRRVVNSRRCMCPLRTRLAKPKAYHFAIGRRGRNGTQLVSKADQARCRRWVNRVGLTVGQPLPLRPYERTLSPPARLVRFVPTAEVSSVAGLARNRTESGTTPANAGLLQSFRQSKFSQVFCHTIQDGRRKDHCLFEF